MAKVIGLGNALVDIMTPLENDDILTQIKFPKGSMQLVDEDMSNDILGLTKHLESKLASGGSAANTIHGIARLGMETAFVGKIGTDKYGEIFKNDLVESKIKPAVFQSQTDTGRAIAMVSPDSERTFATFLGAAVEMTPEEITPAIFLGYDMLHIEGYLVFNEELIEKAVKTAKEVGLEISLDLASFNVVDAKLDFLKNIVEKYVDIVFANEEEAKSFTGEEDPQKALEIIARNAKVSIVKIGKEGSLVLKDNITSKVGVIEAKPIDTTGAGDLYAAGFLYAYLKGLDLEKAGQIGALLAGKVIEVMGAKIADETWVQIQKEVSNIAAQ
ncbi:MAG: adenosine kinase [Bacteroidetes bacterium 4572_77]|nr:MAG: adenosine kinase [Bacteroidetes bacterium 4572_77]